MLIVKKWFPQVEDDITIYGGVRDNNQHPKGGNYVLLMDKLHYE